MCVSSSQGSAFQNESTCVEWEPGCAPFPFLKVFLTLMLNILDDTLIPRGWQVRLPPMAIARVLVCVPQPMLFSRPHLGSRVTSRGSSCASPSECLFVAPGCWLLCCSSCFVCRAVAQVLRQHAVCNQRLDTLSFVFQTLVIKVSGVILSVVGGLAVGKVMQPESLCPPCSP